MSQQLASFSELRTFADTHHNVRAEIERVKAEVGPMVFSIVGADPEQMKALVTFFARPDHDYPDFWSWMKAVIEETLVTDALAIKVNKRVGGGVHSVTLLNGSTVRPVLDNNGHTPPPPATAYTHYLQEVPRVDAVSIVTDADLTDRHDLDALMGYTAYDLLYLIRRHRTWTVYGYPETEQCILNPDGYSVDVPRLLTFLQERLFDTLIQDVLGFEDVHWEWATNLKETK